MPRKCTDQTIARPNFKRHSHGREQHFLRTPHQILVVFGHQLLPDGLSSFFIQVSRWNFPIRKPISHVFALSILKEHTKNQINQHVGTRLLDMAMPRQGHEHMILPCQIGVGRLVSTINWWFSGSMLIYQRVRHLPGAEVMISYFPTKGPPWLGVKRFRSPGVNDLLRPGCHWLMVVWHTMVYKRFIREL